VTSGPDEASSLCQTHGGEAASHVSCFLPAEVLEQSGRDLPVHLLPGGGVPARHHPVPTQRVPGEILGLLVTLHRGVIALEQSCGHVVERRPNERYAPGP